MNIIINKSDYLFSKKKKQKKTTRLKKKKKYLETLHFTYSQFEQDNLHIFRNSSICTVLDFALLFGQLFEELVLTY